MASLAWTYWEFDWKDRPPLTDEEFDDPMKGMWQPVMFMRYDGVYRGRTDYPRPDDAMYHRMTWGQQIDDWDENTKAESDHPLPLEDYPAEIEDIPYSHEAPIVSQRTRDLVERVAPGCVQFLPVTMTQLGGTPIRIGRYWVMNVIKLVDCLDPEPGSFDPLPARVRKYMPPDKVQIDRHRTRFRIDAIPPESALFRMKKEYITVVARCDVREAFEAHGITGVRFLPLHFRVT